MNWFKKDEETLLPKPKLRHVPPKTPGKDRILGILGKNEQGISQDGAARVRLKRIIKKVERLDDDTENSQ